MNLSEAHDDGQVFVLSCDDEPIIREGEWLRLWNSIGVGVAHDVWVGIRGIVYENSGPGGGRKVIQIVSRTAPDELEEKVRFAESKLGTLWAAFHNCQRFASEVATGRASSFQ